MILQLGASMTNCCLPISPYLHSYVIALMSEKSGLLYRKNMFGFTPCIDKVDIGLA